MTRGTHGDPMVNVLHCRLRSPRSIHGRGSVSFSFVHFTSPYSSSPGEFDAQGVKTYDAPTFHPGGGINIPNHLASFFVNWDNLWRDGSPSQFTDLAYFFSTYVYFFAFIIKQITKADEKVLKIFTYVGFALSITGTILTIMSYLFLT